MCPRFHKPSAPAPNLCSPCVCERVFHCCRHLLQSLSHFYYADSLSLAQKEFLPPGISFQILRRISLTFVMQSLSHMQSFSLAVRESVTVVDTCCAVSLTFVVQSLSHVQSLSLTVRVSHVCRHLLRSFFHFRYAESSCSLSHLQ